MLQFLARNWWALALRGVAAVIFGLVALFWPGMTVGALVILFGIYCLVDGVFAMVATFRAVEHHQRWSVFALEGAISILAGLVAIFLPLLAELAFLYLIAAWALLTGILEIVAAMRMRNAPANEWFLILSGAISILLGLVLAAFPASGLLALVWLVGIFALIFGIAMIAFAFRLRGLRGTTGAAPPQTRISSI